MKLEQEKEKFFSFDLISNFQIKKWKTDFSDLIFIFRFQFPKDENWNCVIYCTVLQSRNLKISEFQFFDLLGYYDCWRKFKKVLALLLCFLKDSS